MCYPHQWISRRYLPRRSFPGFGIRRMCDQRWVLIRGRRGGKGQRGFRLPIMDAGIIEKNNNDSCKEHSELGVVTVTVRIKSQNGTQVRFHLKWFWPPKPLTTIKFRREVNALSTQYSAIQRLAASELSVAMLSATVRGGFALSGHLYRDRSGKFMACPVWATHLDYFLFFPRRKTQPRIPTSHCEREGVVVHDN